MRTERTILKVSCGVSTELFPNSQFTWIPPPCFSSSRELLLTMALQSVVMGMATHRDVQRDIMLRSGDPSPKSSGRATHPVTIT